MNTAALSQKDVKRALEWPFDVRLTRRKKKETWFRFAPRNDYTILAVDGTGGVFAAGPSGWISYMSTEGQAGTLAPDLATLLAIVVAYPYWRDLLKFSGGGKLAEMLRVVPHAEREVTADEPDLPASRALLRRALDLPVLANGLATLHEAVASGSATQAIVSPDGERFGSLFGTFTVADNPLWQPRTGQKKKKAKAPRRGRAR